MCGAFMDEKSKPAALEIQQFGYVLRVILRPLDPDNDDFGVLTALLHRAYARLAEMGLKLHRDGSKR